MVATAQKASVPTVAETVAECFTYSETCASWKVHNGAFRGVTEGPFGETLRLSGPAAAANPFRFSTKYFDAETGLYYYGYRYYSPEIGRWLNRDPIGEDGGINIYGFVGNGPLCRTDLLGMSFSTDMRWRLFSTVLDVGFGAVRAWRQLEQDAAYLNAPGVQMSANVTLLGPIVNFGAAVVFFPETCEFGAYKFVLAALDRDVQQTVADANSGYGFDVDALFVTLGSMSFGVEGSVGFTATVAAPLGGGSHGPDSWLDFFGSAGGNIGPGVKVFGSTKWAGMEIALPPFAVGLGGSYVGAWYRYFGGTKNNSTCDLRDIPGGYCMCQAMRLALRDDPSGMGKLSLVLQSAVRDLVK